MKWIDIPPTWLALFALAAWLLARAGFSVDTGTVGVWLGHALILAGLALMAATVWAFHKARTTVIPHHVPSAIVTSGILGWSRNPIYLGDALILAGLCIGWGSLAGIVLVPAFVVLITRRFILAEEARLRTAFPDDFARYEKHVRRW